MKKFILIFTILITILSCDSDSNEYVLNGTIDGVKDGMLVTLKRFENNKPITVDTTQVEQGSFTFKGNVETPDIYALYIQNVRGNLPFILENKKLNFTMYKDSLAVSKIKGSKENDVAQEFMNGTMKIRKEAMSLKNELRQAQKDRDTVFMSSYNDKMNDLKEKNTQYTIDYIKENNTQIFGALLLENLLLNKAISVKEINEINETFSQNIHDSPPGKRINEKLSSILSTKEGAVAPNFTAPSPDGKEISLNDIKGKVTIIDFWAAWCGPCRKENPNVVKVYEKYHDKGLEIISVSLDGNPRQKEPKKEWLNAIEKDGLKWHHVSNLNYFNGPVAKKYNISSIPATFILDSEGKIIAKNLRGPALEKKIAELLD